MNEEHIPRERVVFRTAPELGTFARGDGWRLPSVWLIRFERADRLDHPPPTSVCRGSSLSHIVTVATQIRNADAAGAPAFPSPSEGRLGAPEGR